MHRCKTEVAGLGPNSTLHFMKQHVHLFHSWMLSDAVSFSVGVPYKVRVRVPRILHHVLCPSMCLGYGAQCDMIRGQKEVLILWSWQRGICSVPKHSRLWTGRFGSSPDFVFLQRPSQVP